MPSTQRQRFDYDLTQCIANGCNPWHNQAYADAFAQLSRAKTAAKATSEPARGGFAEYIEHSSWNQYQPFVEMDLHPIEDLTITPGFKYVGWQHDVNAPSGAEGQAGGRVNVGSFTTTHDLPFAEANYKIEPNWSVYAQYAKGIYVPDISAFEQKTGVLNTVHRAQGEDHHQLPGRHGLLCRQLDLRRRRLLHRRRTTTSSTKPAPRRPSPARSVKPVPSTPALRPTKASKARAPMPLTTRTLADG